MNATREICSWNNIATSTLRVEDCVSDYLSGGGVEFGERCSATGSYARMVDGYRDAINEAFPEGISLNGDVVYGPADTDIALETLREIVEEIDLGAIVERHDPDRHGNREVAEVTGRHDR